MAITGLTSYGYDSTVTEVPWAAMADELGAAYGVKDESHFRVSYSGTSLTVQVAAGTAQGHGVLDILGANGNLTLSAVGSGVRYDTVVIRRNWTTNTTTVDVIPGTSSAVVAASRLVNPGVQDDQPLALVQVTAGSTIPVVVADLREFGSKVRTVADLRALVDPKHGDQAVVAGNLYRYVLDVTNSPAWVPANVNRVYDSTYGWMPRVVSGRSFPSITTAGTGSIIIALGATVPGAEKYAFSIFNGDFGANPVHVTGYAALTGNQTALNVRYDGAVVGGCRLDWTATYLAAS